MGSNEAEPSNANSKKVAYIWSKEYEEVSDCLPSNLGRVFPGVTTALILVFTNPFPDPRIQSRQTHDVRVLLVIVDKSIVEPKPASVEELCTFHDEDYIDFLLSSHGSPRPKRRKRSSSTSSSSSSEQDPYENYGLEYVYP